MCLITATFKTKPEIEEVDWYGTDFGYFGEEFIMNFKYTIIFCLNNVLRNSRLILWNTLQHSYLPLYLSSADHDVLMSWSQPGVYRMGSCSS